MNTDKKISRREALKRMGFAVMSGAIASSGLLSLASCETKRSKRIIFYFTGTGNSLYIARQLAGENAELLSIPQMVKRGKYEFEADEIGIVYPIYGHMPPYMVRQFIQKAKLKAEYKFAVLTYGARKCDAVEIWDRISRKADNAFDYINTIIMVDNWLPNFDMNEQLKIDKHIPENLQKITADINSRQELARTSFSAKWQWTLWRSTSPPTRTGDGGGTATAPRFYAAEWTRPRGGLPDEKREVLYRDRCLY